MMADNLITALSETEIAEIDKELAHVPVPAGAAIDALKIVQAHRGWISDASLAAIAKHLHMSTAELDGIATFYTLIFRRPVGEKVILLCNSVTCWMKGCDNLQAGITEQLGIGMGETTADNKYTLLPMTCLGACDKAPVMMVGDDLHEDVTRSFLGDLFHNAGGQQ